MSRPTPDRMELLSRRVQWVDRWHRPVSVVFAIGIFFTTMSKLGAFPESEWPRVLSASIALLGSVIAWWIAEVGFAWMTALWETELDTLAKDHGLPRAQLVRRRRV